MSNLTFKYGAMNCGKTNTLIQVAHNYEENDKVVRVIKSLEDSKGKDYITSRTGLKRKVDILIGKDESFEKYFDDWNDNVHCILVDEAQFLTEKQIEELWLVTKLYDIPVFCYGLRTHFKSNTFEGSKRLLELADIIEELPTICNCGEDAKFNARFFEGEFTLEGDDVEIDGEDPRVKYKPMCGKCYVKKRIEYYNNR